MVLKVYPCTHLTVLPRLGFEQRSFVNMPTRRCPLLQGPELCGCCAALSKAAAAAGHASGGRGVAVSMRYMSMADASRSNSRQTVHYEFGCVL